jgi:hypothetical protein
MRMPVLSLFLIAAALLGEIQAASAQSPTSYPWCAHVYSRGRRRRRISHASEPLSGSSLPRPRVPRLASGAKFLRYLLQRRRQVVAHLGGHGATPIGSMPTPGA